MRTCDITQVGDSIVGLPELARRTAPRSSRCGAGASSAGLGGWGAALHTTSAAGAVYSDIGIGPEIAVVDGAPQRRDPLSASMPAAAKEFVSGILSRVPTILSSWRSSLRACFNPQAMASTQRMHAAIMVWASAVETRPVEPVAPCQ